MINYEDEKKLWLYGSAYLEKAKKEKDTAQIFRGYEVFAYLHKNDESFLTYADSIISLAKTFNNDRFRALGYIKRGNYYSEIFQNDSALNNYMIAKRYAKDSPGLDLVIDHNIARIKILLGEDEEALEVVKKSWKYKNEGNYKETNLPEYLVTLSSLADCYSRVDKYDSASFYNRLGVKESLKANYQGRYLDFVSNEGISQYHNENYDVAYDSINKTLDYYSKQKDKTVYVVLQYYIGQILLKRKKVDSAMIYFKLVDSFIATREDKIMPNVRESYEALIKYYKDKKDPENHLKYIQRLLSYDSVLNIDYKQLSKKITKEYDTPRLLEEKEALIASLEEEKNTTSTQNIIISALLGISILGGGYYYYNQRRYKQRFLQLLDTTQPQKPVKESPNKNKSSISHISQDTIDHLLAQLQQFEEAHAYLKPKINSKDLAKSFGSNSSYLSLVVNTYKQKSLSQYINDLRIEYAVQKLQENSKFRKYTIKAIAQEMGFNTSEAFAKTFYKKTGIYPSYFIKELEKKNND